MTEYTHYLLIEYTEDDRQYFRVLEDERKELRKYEPQDGEKVTLLRRRKRG